MSQQKDTAANAIRFGDYIYLRTNITQTFGGTEPGFLYADGMCLGRTGVQKSAAIGEDATAAHHTRPSTAALDVS